MTKVSVLMSVYNGETLPPGSHESILKQTFRDFSSSLWMMALRQHWQILTLYAGQDSDCTHPQ